jgi:hypothetical protein
MGLKFEIEVDEDHARAEITFPDGKKKRFVGVSVTVESPVNQLGLDNGELVFYQKGHFSFTLSGTEIT